jgi:hypothetical protein
MPLSFGVENDPWDNHFFHAHAPVLEGVAEGLGVFGGIVGIHKEILALAKNVGA